MPEDFQTNFYFSLSISGDNSDADAAFQEASGLSAQLNVEEVVSGGENRFKYRLPSVVTYQNLVLKRGVATSSSSRLISWCQNIFKAGLAHPINCKDITLFLMDLNGKVSLQWCFVKAYPIKWSMGDLKSQESNLLIETIEFAYQYFEVTDPRSSAKKKA